MLTLSGKEIKVLKKYYKPNLFFVFNSEKQKGYLIDTE